jgi:hypothetical protein
LFPAGRIRIRDLDLPSASEANPAAAQNVRAGGEASLPRVDGAISPILDDTRTFAAAAQEHGDTEHTPNFRIVRRSLSISHANLGRIVPSVSILLG